MFPQIYNMIDNHHANTQRNSYTFWWCSITKHCPDLSRSVRFSSLLTRLAVLRMINVKCEYPGMIFSHGSNLNLWRNLPPKFLLVKTRLPKDCYKHKKIRVSLANEIWLNNWRTKSFKDLIPDPVASTNHRSHDWWRILHTEQELVSQAKENNRG